MEPLATWISGSHGVSLSYPKTWRVIEVPEHASQEIIVMFEYPTFGKDMVAPTLTLGKLSAQGMNLNQYTEESLKQLRAMMGRDISVTDHTVGALPGKLLDYEITTADGKVRFRIAWSLRNNTVYSLSFSAPNELFEKYEKLMMEIIAEFKFLSKDEAERVEKEQKATRPISSLYCHSYCDPGNNFSIGVPNEWVASSPEYDWPTIAVRNCHYTWTTAGDSPVELDFTVAVHKVDSGVDIYKYMQLFKLQLKKLFPKYSEDLLSSSQCRIGRAGLDARRFDFVSPVTKEQTAVAFTVQDGKAFTFNFHNSAPLSDKRSLVLFERLLYSFSLNPEPSDPLPNFYENLKDKVGIFFPKHYIVQEGFMGTTVTLIEQGGVSNDFATNVTLTIRGVEESVTLERFEEIVRHFILQATGGSLDEISKSQIKIAGVPAIQVILVCKIGDFSVKFAQRFFIKHKKGYILGFGSVASEFDKKFEQVGRLMLERFYLIDDFKL